MGWWRLEGIPSDCCTVVSLNDWIERKSLPSSQNTNITRDAGDGSSSLTLSFWHASNTAFAQFSYPRIIHILSGHTDQLKGGRDLVLTAFQWKRSPLFHFSIPTARRRRVGDLTFSSTVSRSTGVQPGKRRTRSPIRIITQVRDEQIFLSYHINWSVISIPCISHHWRRALQVSQVWQGGTLSSNCL